MSQTIHLESINLIVLIVATQFIQIWSRSQTFHLKLCQFLLDEFCHLRLILKYFERDEFEFSIILEKTRITCWTGPSLVKQLLQSEIYLLDRDLGFIDHLLSWIAMSSIKIFHSFYVFQFIFVLDSIDSEFSYFLRNVKKLSIGSIDESDSFNII